MRPPTLKVGAIVGQGTSRYDVADRQALGPEERVTGGTVPFEIARGTGVNVSLSFGHQAELVRATFGPHPHFGRVYRSCYKVIERAAFVPADEQMIGRCGVVIGTDRLGRTRGIADPVLPSAEAASAKVDGVEVGHGNNAEDGQPFVAVGLQERHIDGVARAHANKGVGAVKGGRRATCAAIAGALHVECGRLLH